MPIGGILQLLTEAIVPSATFTFNVKATIITVCLKLQVTCTFPLSSVCAIFVFNDCHIGHFVSFQEGLI
jgi:hypothetical protein